MAYKDKSAAVKYNNEFIKSAYDRINLTVPKGRKAELQAVAAQHGQSVNGFINGLIDEALERERAGDDGSSTGAQFPYFSDGEDTPLVAVGSSPTGGEESLSAEPDFSKMAVEEWVEWKRRRTGESDRTWYERVSRSINTISKVGCSSYWSYLSKLSLAEKDILDRKNWRG